MAQTVDLYCPGGITARRVAFGSTNFGRLGVECSDGMRCLAWQFCGKRKDGFTIYAVAEFQLAVTTMAPDHGL